MRDGGARMLPTMTTPPRPGKWVRVQLPNGTRAMVTTRIDPERGRLVVIKPLPDKD